MPLPDLKQKRLEELLAKVAPQEEPVKVLGVIHGTCCEDDATLCGQGSDDDWSDDPVDCPVCLTTQCPECGEYWDD